MYSFTAIGKSMPVHITGVLWFVPSRDKCYRFKKNEPRDQLVSPTKYKIERERAQHGNHGRRQPWPLASPMPRLHVLWLNKFI